MNQSKLFTDKQLMKVNERINGDKGDKTGMFSTSIKPKVIELLQMLYDIDKLFFWKGVIKGRPLTELEKAAIREDRRKRWD